MKRKILTIVFSLLALVLLLLLGGPLLVRLGLLRGAIGFVLVALAVDYITTLLALGFFIFTLALIGPTLNSYISAFAGEHQGTVMGLNSAMTSLGRVVGPLWGAVHLRYQHRISILQWRGDIGARVAGQPHRVTEAGRGEYDAIAGSC